MILNILLNDQYYLAEICSSQVPRIGEKIELLPKDEDLRAYIVEDVTYSYEEMHIGNYRDTNIVNITVREYK